MPLLRERATAARAGDCSARCSKRRFNEDELTSARSPGCESPLNKKYQAARAIDAARTSRRRSCRETRAVVEPKLKALDGRIRGDARRAAQRRQRKPGRLCRGIEGEALKMRSGRAASKRRAKIWRPPCLNRNVAADPKLAFAARADRRGRPRAARAAQPARRRSRRRSASSRSAKARWSFRPEREAQVIDGLKARQRRPAAHRRAWRRSGARSCRRAARSRRRRAWPTSGRPAPSASSPRSATSARRSSSVPCASIDEVFRATSAGAADFGVVPVENSTEGVVARSLDLFLTTPLFIIGETSLFVRHNLLRKVDSLDGIAAVCAHPQALAQCHGWLSRTTCRTPSAARWRATPKARASRASTRRSRASPASAPAASSACTWWRRRSRTMPHNRTRFAIVTHPGSPSAAEGFGPRLHQPRRLGRRTGRARCTTCWCR